MRIKKLTIFLLLSFFLILVSVVVLVFVRGKEKPTKQTENTVSLQEGNSIGIFPSYFPIDFPIYKGVGVDDVSETTTDDKKAISFNQKIGSNLSDVVDYYEKELAKNGWQVNKKILENSTIFSVEKEEQGCSQKCNISGFVGILASSKNSTFVSVTLGFK